MTRERPASGCPGGTAATSPSLMIGKASNPSGGAVAVPDESEIDRTGADPFDEAVGTVLGQRDLDPGVRDVERGQRVEQRLHRAGGDHPDDEPAPDQLVHVVHGLPHRVGRGEGRAGVHERRFSRGRECRRPARPVDQRGAEVVLELPDLRADPRLADVDAFRGTGEVRFLGDRDEVLQLPQFHKQ